MLRSDYIKALDDYKVARRRAEIQALFSRLTGKRDDLDLLSYDDVRQQLQAREKTKKHLAEIPLDAIVGSVGRYHDFTRSFLPKASINQERWARVMAETKGLTGLPPIEVYKINDVFFVKDGNHRVSVARQLGNKTIQAYITEVETKVTITQDTKPDDLIIKSEYVKFLELTKLDQNIQDIDLIATTPGAYPTLIEHINVHRYYLGVNQQQEIPFPEAASNWYQHVYQPVISMIQKRGMLRDFPDRTAADLYLWIADHRNALIKEIGWDIGPEAALTDLSERHDPNRKYSIRNFFTKLLQWIIPDFLRVGPPPGSWRKRLFEKIVLENLFADLIVAIDDSPNAWNALKQATYVAQIERSRIHGIHVHSEVSDTSPQEHMHIEDDFNAHCRISGVIDYDFLVIEGDISEVLCEQARFADLIILPLNYPPEDKPVKRIGSGIRTLLRSCPVPIMTVSSEPTQFNHLLLAYDGSIKAKEALYIAAYFGSQNSASLSVLTSTIGVEDPVSIQEEARTYISDYPIQADYLITDSSIPKQIHTLLDTRDIDLVLMGGYGGESILDVMLGSTVDQVLREISLPVLICK